MTEFSKTDAGPAEPAAAAAVSSAKSHTKIPATVITGFLGAGKTSLVRHLAETANGKRFAFIVNEFGDLGVDGEIIRGCGIEGCEDDDVIELANGCICCTVADDFLPTIEKILSRPDQPDHIIVETSGLALPKPLVRAFGWPDVRTRVTVDAVITVVDGDAVERGLFAPDPDAVAAQREVDENLDHETPLEELFEEQIQCADMVVVNKADLLGEAGLEAVNAAIGRHARPAVRTVVSEHGRIAAAVALGLDAAAEDDLDSRPSHHDGAHDDHDHDDFESFVVDLETESDPAALEARILAAVEAYDILRVKGFIHVEGRDMRLALQGVGPRLQSYYDRDWQSAEERAGRLVVIGHHGMDEGTIAAAIRGTA